MNTYNFYSALFLILSMILFHGTNFIISISITIIATCRRIKYPNGIEIMNPASFGLFSSFCSSGITCAVVSTVSCLAFLVTLIVYIISAFPSFLMIILITFSPSVRFSGCSMITFSLYIPESCKISNFCTSASIVAVYSYTFMLKGDLMRLLVFLHFLLLH